MALLIMWASGALLVIAALSLKHVVALPPPDGLTSFQAVYRELRRTDSGMLLIHVISAQCSCTQRLARSLLKRGAVPGIDEVVLYVGESGSLRGDFEKAGFRFSAIGAETLVERYRVDAAPVLIVIDATDRLRYAGGYFRHPSAGRPVDQELMSQIDRGERVAPLPVFGCAVGTRLTPLLDPYGLSANL